MLVLCLVTLSTMPAMAQNAFIESDGLVVIEAESIGLVGDWVQESSDAGYTGAGYIRWNGPNYLNDPGHGILAYTVVVPAAGNYNVRLRMSHMGAPAGDQWNDVWVQMNGGAWVKAVHPSTRIDEGFTFHSPLEPTAGEFEGMRYSLNAGENTLYISGRSTNLRLDRIHFYKDSVVDPLNPALPESERTESSGGGGGGGGGGGSDQTPASISIDGEQKKWHPITLTLTGPQASETGTPNPFLDFRFEVTFSQGSHQYTVPGFFAADGNAGETSAASGNKWRVHFVPDRTGPWNYVVSMRSGTDVAINTDPNAGAPTAFDGLAGSFNVTDTDKVGADHRAKGILRYVGEHYLRFDNGQYFLKGGADSPENFLAYEDFDGTFNHEGVNFVKDYSPHVNDWNADDPTWKGGKGKGIIGGLNYLASKGMNVVYFITMNIQGDGKDVWPWTGPGERVRYDVSKLDQWNIVFNHMDRLGIMLHVLTQETENELLLDGGALGRVRKLYYRELVARFGYHHAITWNLGEENDENTDAQRKNFASYIRTLDPYDHPIVIHTFPGQYDKVYTPLLGFGDFEGPSIQINGIEKSHEETLKWRERSANSGRPWVVTIDEQGPYQIGVSEDGPGNNHYQIRRHVLWGNLMAGGGGVEYYFGYDTASHDLNTENWRTRESMWNYTRHALEFFHSYLPFHEMMPMDGLSAKTNDYVFAKPGTSYAIYTPDGGTLNLDLAAGEYTVRWFNPRTGGGLLTGGVSTVSGPGVKSIGAPPADTQFDWVALVRSTSDDVNMPSILVSPTTLDFQGVMPGATKTLPATITNNGGANLSISAIDIAGANAGLFTLQSNPAPLTLAPGASNVVQIMFAPGATDSGAKNAVLRISSNDPQSPTMNVSLNGTVESSSDNGGGDNGGGDNGGGDNGGGDNGGGDNGGGNNGGRTRSISVIGFTLVNSQTGEEIKPLKNGDVVDFSKLPSEKINIRADTDPAQVGSVQFSLNRNSNFQMENSAPYALAGDIGDDYNSWEPKAGEHKLIARPYSSHNGTGALGIALEITFTVTMDGELPSLIQLDQNYPNPFSNSTTITFTNEKAGDARLVVYDLMGREVARLVDRLMPAGTFQVIFDASDLRSGAYFYRYENNGYVETKKMLLVK